MTGTTAAVLLARAGVEGKRVSRVLGGLRLEAVSFLPAPRWLRVLWPASVRALTMPWAVYVRPDVLEDDTDAGLVLHELVHVAQWRRLGVPGFLARYVGDYLRARCTGDDHHDAYRTISLERAAFAGARWRSLTGVS